MIKFFRHIRKSLLNEGKTSKYFKYAIGEIVLVVIGIMIALQINNWNENRISQNSKTQYFEQLLEEIELDITGIKVNLERLDGAVKSYDTYETIYETSNISLDTIYNNIRKLPKSYGPVSFNTKTIEVLKSTGDIKLLPNKIQILLVNLETSQEKYRMVNTGNYGMYMNLVKETYLMNGFSIESKLANQARFAKALDFKSKLPEQLAKQHLAFSIKNFADLNASIVLNEILITVNELKLLIEKELKK